MMIGLRGSLITRRCIHNDSKNDRYNLYKNRKYNRIRALRPFVLQRGDRMPEECYTIFRMKPTDEEPNGLFIFQDKNETQTSVILFEEEEDAELFTSALAADCDASAFPMHALADTSEVIKLCDALNFLCLFSPKGSCVTPFNIDLPSHDIMK